MKKLPLTQKDFDWYKLTPKQITEIGREAVEYKKAAYKKIKEILPENRTYENTLYALERGDGPAGDMLRRVALLGEVSPKEEVRTAASETLIAVSSQMVDIEYDRDLYIAMMEYHEGNFLDEKKTLGKDDIKLLTETIREYKRMGFDLPLPTQKKLKTLLKRSSKLGEQFRKNINDYNDYILCTKEELAGVSERTIDSFPKDEKSGKYIVSLQYPHFGPFMSYAHNREKREELANKNLKKGGTKNLKIIAELVEIRAEISKILGYAHHADFRTENRMAKSGLIAETFQNNLLKKLIVPAKKDVEEIRTHARTLGLSKVEHYDVAYVANDLKKKLYDVDPETTRTYFPLNHVMEQMFKNFGILFGIKFSVVPFKTWHKDVTVYEVKNKNNTLVGYMFFDLFPRLGKYGHAMCVDTEIARETFWKSNTFIAPVTGIVCNFPAPTKKNPSLLSIGEVETLFHEFGHGLHMTLSSTRHESQGGSNVAWDFVETPSQIMENWVWNDDMLKKLSKHVKTGVSMPKDMRAKILAGKKFQNAYHFMRQILMGKLDIDLHMGKIKDATQAYRSMIKMYTGVDLPEKETLFPAGFGHLVGYDAGYYSYLWALVYAQDAFSEFEAGGILNPEIGMRWRKEVLEKGSSEDEFKLVKNFLGRKPSDKAFLRELGVK
jgi:thimet oligopeptidase